MDLLSLVRTLGALGVVLGMLAGALWAVRRFDIRLPGRVGGGTLRRVELVERAQLDARRSVALFRRDGREHLILLSPEGNVILESGIVRDALDLAAEQQRLAEAEERKRAAEEAMAVTKAEMEALRQSFADMVESTSAKARDRVGQAVEAAREKAGPAAKRAKTRIAEAVSTAEQALRTRLAAIPAAAAPTPEIAIAPLPQLPPPARVPRQPRKRPAAAGAARRG